MSIFNSIPFLFAVLIFLIIVIIIRQIDWRKWAVKWVGYDPGKGRIYIEYGNTVESVAAKRTKVNNEGSEYIYKFNGQESVIIVPESYGYLFLKYTGERIIGLKDGKLVANCLGFFDEETQRKYRENIADISIMEQSTFLIQLIKSVKESKVMNWMLIGVIVVAAIAGYMYYIHYQNAGKLGTANITTQQESVPEQHPNEIVIP